MNDGWYQQAYGTARINTDAAVALILSIGDRLEEWEADAFSGRIPFTHDKDTYLMGLVLQAGRLSREASDLLFRTSGSSEARKGTRSERYIRDSLMFQTHGGAQFEAWAQRLGSFYLGATERIF